jgi:hypothetical protein
VASRAIDLARKNDNRVNFVAKAPVQSDLKDAAIDRDAGRQYFGKVLVHCGPADSALCEAVD